VRTESKAQGVVRTLLSVNIEHIRVGKYVVIPVSGLVGSNNAFASTNELDCMSACVSMVEIYILTFPPNSMSSLATLFIAIAEPV
jgi:hypothetical protein